MNSAPLHLSNLHLLPAAAAIVKHTISAQLVPVPVSVLSLLHDIRHASKAVCTMAVS